MAELKTRNEIRINDKWVREDELDPEFVKQVIFGHIDYGMKSQGFIRKDKTA